MTFAQLITLWLDTSNLVGSSVSPERWSSGNPILDTAMAIDYEIELSHEKADVTLIRKMVAAIEACKSENGSFNKNPGRPDEITQDDLLAAAATQRLASTTFATYICELGEKTGWQLGNTGQPYFNAFARPWDIATYKLMATKVPTYYETAALIGAVIYNTVMCALKKSTPSGDRQRRLHFKAIAGQNMLVDLATIIWAFVARSRYTTVAAMEAAYRQTTSHPFVQFGSTINF